MIWFFLLLIFFLLTSVFQVPPAVQTNLPESSTATTISPQDIVISMKENGDVFLNDKKMSLHALEHILKHTISSGNNNEVSIASDKM